MRYDWYFRDGVLDKFDKKILKEVYAIVEYPYNNLMELLLYYSYSEIEAYRELKVWKKKYPKSKVIKDDVILLKHKNIEIKYKLAPKEIEDNELIRSKV